MNISKLPLNKRTTIIAEKYIVAVANRISKNEVIISYINLKNHKEVLRVLHQIDKDTQMLQYLEADFWNIYSDGKRIANYDFSSFKDVEIKMKVTTADKSLEIMSFNHGHPARRSRFFNKFMNPVK